jgi:hypothetical protein
MQTLEDFFSPITQTKTRLYPSKQTHHSNPKLHKFAFEGQMLTAWELAQDPRNIYKIKPKGIHARCLRSQHEKGAFWLFLNPKLSKGPQHTLTTGEVLTVAMMVADPRNTRKRMHKTFARRVQKGILDPETLWS